MTLISFIVPVYNSESTLESCVKSLLDQGLDSGTFEILLVNDGSSDGSAQLCETLSARHDPVRVLNQDHKGLPDSRNKGIKEAKGEWLCFVDSDDTLVPGGVSSLLKYCEPDIDLVRFYCNIYYGSVPAKTGCDNPGAEIFRGNGHGYLRQFGFETFCWNYLYRKSFLETKGLEFYSGIVAEDFRFIFDVMMANPGVVSLDSVIYQYYIRPGSQSMARDEAQSRRRVKDMAGSLEHIIKELDPIKDSDHALYDNCFRRIDGKMLAIYSRVLTANYSSKEYLSLIKSFRASGLLPLRSGAMNKVWSKLIIMLTVNLRLYKPIAWLYRMVFIPIVYPFIRRYSG